MNLGMLLRLRRHRPSLTPCAEPELVPLGEGLLLPGLPTQRLVVERGDQVLGVVLVLSQVRAAVASDGHAVLHRVVPVSERKGEMTNVKGLNTSGK